MYIGGSMVEERDGMRRDGCLEGTPNWRIAQFGWVCLWKDGTFVLGGRGIGAGAWFGWGVFVEGRDFCFGGTPNWRIARFDWDVFVEGRDFCFEGTRNWRIARFRWMCL